jgi:predicted transcriptional regulator
MMTDTQDTAISGTEFWAIKHETDDIAQLLGWSKTYCKKYIQAHYGCHSRLVMTDYQLRHLLDTLTDLQVKASKKKKRKLRRI